MSEVEKVVVIEKPHQSMWAEPWAAMQKWWSVRIGVLGMAAMAGIPALADQFPHIAPSLISWFPKHGQQWVPVLGAGIAVVARVLNQEFIASRMRAFFERLGGNSGSH
jgi:hypothetical protein